jgi:DNA-binding protein Fis
MSNSSVRILAVAKVIFDLEERVKAARVELAALVGMSARSALLFEAALAEFEKSYWLRLAASCRGNISEMARMSGKARASVRDHLQKYGLRSQGNTWVVDMPSVAEPIGAAPESDCVPELVLGLAKQIFRLEERLDAKRAEISALASPRAKRSHLSKKTPKSSVVAASAGRPSERASKKTARTPRAKPRGVPAAAPLSRQA